MSTSDADNTDLLRASLIESAFNGADLRPVSVTCTGGLIEVVLNLADARRLCDVLEAKAASR